MNLPGYDAWKLAYPHHWDKEQPDTFDGLTECLDCGRVWDADEEKQCPRCGSTDLVELPPEPNYDD